MRVFISWSGPRANQLAVAVKKYFKHMLQALELFFSQEDLPMGSRWTNEIYTPLSEMNFGIVCVTADSIDAKWTHFEAGALAKDQKSRVIPYLLDVKKEDLVGPFSTLNVASVNREDSLRVLKTLNDNLPIGTQLPGHVLQESFDIWYPGFEQAVKAIPKFDAKPREAPSPADQFDLLKSAMGTLQSQIRTLTSDVQQLLRERSFRSGPVPVVDYGSRRPGAHVSVTTAPATLGTPDGPMGPPGSGA